MAELFTAGRVGRVIRTLHALAEYFETDPSTADDLTYAETVLLGLRAGGNALHKPAYLPPWQADYIEEQDVWAVSRDDEQGGPWWATPDRLVDHLGWIGGFSVYSGEGEEIAEVFTAANDAAAIADLWCWIERAERYEEALRRIANGWTWTAQKAETVIAEFPAYAARVLEEEGRL